MLLFFYFLKNSIIISNQAVGQGQISPNRNVGQQGRAGADVIGHEGAAAVSCHE